MAKEKLTLQKQLSNRRYHIPSRLNVWIYHFIMSDLVMPKFHPHYEIVDDINDCKGPCFLIWNHLSRIDHAYLMQAAYPRRISILAGYNEFFRSHLHTVFKMMNILPKRIYDKDVSGIRAITEIVEQGGCVAFAPEGMSSIYGTNQPIVPGTGHLLKHFHIPVYFLELKGQYLANTKVCLDERYGSCEAKLSLLFTSDDLIQMSDIEIEDKINLSFRHDDYEWGQKEHIKWETNGKICDHLNDICYQCPKCGKEMTMIAKDDEIVCSNCGNGAKMDEYYEFHPFDDKCVIPKTPSAWVSEERVYLIKAIRKDPNYRYSVPVDFGYLPPYDYVTDHKTSEICGSGIFTIDHEGIHYSGTKLGDPFSLDLDYHQVFSLPIVTDVTHFSLFTNKQFYCFYPKSPVAGKLLLLTEEMHRLHVNTWKNFPWNDYMYQNLDEQNWGRTSDVLPLSLINVIMDIINALSCLN